MASLLSTTVNGTLNSTGRITASYNGDRYQMNFYRASASNWWITNDSDRLGIHLNNVGDKFYFANDGDFWTAQSGWLSTALSGKVSTSGGSTVGGITYFSNGESMQVYGIRGRFTNEYIHLYHKVGIGNPNGWGEGQGSTPGYGLSTYGGAVFAYGNNATSSFNGHLRIDRNWGNGDYSAEQFTIRGSSPSITFRDTGHNSKWLMHIDSGNVNFYYGGTVDDNSWGRKLFIPTDGNIWMSWAGDYISNLLGAKQNASTAITTSNIGSQSVNYASSAGSAGQVSGVAISGSQAQALKNTLDSPTLPYKCDIYVEGEANKFYPVHFMFGDQDIWRRIIIRRGYGEEAPWDPIGTGVHHGGLLIDWEGNFGGWGGAEYADRLRVYNESYTNVCADMYLYTHAMGYVFMLRGGHALYHIFSDQPIRGYYQEGTPDIAYSSSTLFYDDNWSGNNTYDVYAPRPLELNEVNSSRIDGLRTKKQSLFDSRYQLASSAINTGNIGSQSVSYAASSGAVTHSSGRTDSSWYNAIWGAGTPSLLYSCDAVRIQSSTGAVRANIFYDNQDTGYYVDPNGNSVLTTATFTTNGNSTITLTSAGTNASMIKAGAGDELYLGGNDTWQMRFNGGNVLMDNGGYLQNNQSLRAPIFYDSDDTGFYVDPNGTSNLRKFSEFTMAYNGMNPKSANSPYVDRYNGSVGYRNGTMGFANTDFNVIARNWGSGFIDTWSTPANAPGGSSHYIGLQGVHYSDGGTSFYGFQMACAGEADNRFFWRSSWPNMRSWVEMIHSGNIASQSVSYADESGYSASSGSVEWTSVQNKPATFPPSTHNHDDRYLVKGGSWYGSGLPGSRWGGFSVSGGEIVFGDGLPNAGQMGILIDGAYLAGENNGFWSLASDNSWSSRRGMYWDGTYLNFTANSAVALFSDILISSASNTPVNITGAAHKYITINPGNGWEAMVRYVGGSGSSWYVGKRMTSQVVGTESFHFYSEAASQTVGGIDTGGNMIVTGSYQLSNGFTISQGGSNYGRFNSWVHLPGVHGFYSDVNGAHFYPNNATYGSWRIAGSRNGWHGIHFDSNATLMMNGAECGIHHEGVGWKFRWYNGEMYISAGSTGGGTERTVIHSGNIGSQSVNYATSAGSSSSSSRSSALDIVGYGSGNMTYYQSSGTFAGQSGWAGYFISNHGDGATYYNQTIIMPFWGAPQYSRLQGGGAIVGPYTFWTTENLNDYAPNMNQYVRTSDNVTFNTTTAPTILVNNHSDNTKGYRIHNTSGSSVSAMFTNSSNQLVIAAGAVDQINLNKKVYVNGVALGVNVTPSSTAGRIDASNDIVAYSSSDERLKYNITPIENAIDKVKSLTGVEFDWKPEYKHAHGYEGHDTGIIAQQVQEVIPSAVRTNDTGFLAVRYEKLIGLLVEGMKEQQAQIEELKAKIDGLTK